jgi:hypothetical protein
MFPYLEKRLCRLPGSTGRNLPGCVTRIGVTDETGQYKECKLMGGSIDLSAITKWTGTKDLTLSIDPATGHGKYVRIRSVKVCYP